ncbi:hypothetical protein [Flavobacterium sp. XGLA_31]|uniref:hypothetical protein n=1 Tax=Flavobacterium sp. XGLA_31 TaxID=3447666 RepID=UPI003F3D071A
MNRICIYTKDIQVITGKSERVCRQILKQIRRFKNKDENQLLTVYDLCEYLGVELQSIIHLIR